MSEVDRLDRLIAAEQDERRRIALFLHDGPVQNLSGIALMLDATVQALHAGKLDDAQAMLATAVDQQRNTIRELRELSFAFEPVVLRDQGLSPALLALAERIEASHGLRIDLELGDAELLGETVQVALYTIVRELLDLAVRRGPPTRVTVKLTATADGRFVANVADDAEAERRLRSYESVEERVTQLHGTLSVEVGTRGTTVTVTLPSYAGR
ncbi:MAG TPA: histidine kinase [Gaiellaceae bacterium]